MRIGLYACILGAPVLALSLDEFKDQMNRDPGLDFFCAHVARFDGNWRRETLLDSEIQWQMEAAFASLPELRGDVPRVIRQVCREHAHPGFEKCFAMVANDPNPGNSPSQEAPGLKTSVVANSKRMMQCRSIVDETIRADKRGFIVDGLEYLSHNAGTLFTDPLGQEYCRRLSGLGPIEVTAIRDIKRLYEYGWVSRSMKKAIGNTFDKEAAVLHVIRLMTYCKHSDRENMFLRK